MKNEKGRFRRGAYPSRKRRAFMLRAVPEVKKITVEVVDRDAELSFEPGEDIVEDFELKTKKMVFIGYVKGGGCPVPIAIEAGEVWSAYDTDFLVGEEGLEQAGSVVKLIHAQRRAEWILRRDLLVNVLRDKDGQPMAVEDANILANDGADGMKILWALKWLINPADAKIGDDTEGEAARVDSLETGESTSPTSAQSTQESTSTT